MRYPASHLARSVALAVSLLAAGSASAEQHVVLYSANDDTVNKLVSDGFAKATGIKVDVVSTGSGVLVRRITSEAANPQGDVIWGVSATILRLASPYLQPYQAKEREAVPAQFRDPGDLWLGTNIQVVVIGQNTKAIDKASGPKSWADLLDPKWKGKLVKGHPGYSGAILTATFLIVRELGWAYLEKLAQQRVMQVQSAADPPKKVQVGERAVMADGNDYSLILLKDQGHQVEVVYPTEGSPLVTVHNGVFRSAPNPNAARLFQSYMFSAEAQQVFLDVFAHRSLHAQVKEKPGRTPLSAIKILRADPAAVLKQTEEIKARYARIFGV